MRPRTAPRRVDTACPYALLLLCFLLLPRAAPAQTIRAVPGGYPTIQAAIDASEPGDTVLVDPGHHAGPIDFLGKEITVRSAEGPEATWIDARRTGSTVRFRTEEGRESVLEGFTVTGGSGTFVGQRSYGGGIFCDGASPTLIGNLVIGNTAEFGGGIACRVHANPLFEGNRIEGNQAVAHGGGLYCEELSFPVLRDVEIEENFTTMRGGGVFLSRSSPDVIGCRIASNRAGAGGGGLYIQEDSFPLISGCVVADNLSETAPGGGVSCVESAPVIAESVISGNRAIGNASDGGGVYVFRADPIIRDSVITGNESIWDGGGIFAWFESRPLIFDNLITGNRSLHSGGGVAVAWNSSPELRGNRIAGNVTEGSGGGLSLIGGADARLDGNDIVENTARAGSGIFCNGSSPTISSTVVAFNVALDGGGGGIFLTWDSRPYLANVTVARNSAAGRGAGVLVSRSHADLANVVLRGNASGEQAELEVVSGGTASMRYCVLPGGWPGPGNRDVDPLFVNAPAGDFRLRLDSPLVDSGDDSALPLGEKDKDGEDRFVDGDRDGTITIDVGAFELVPHVAARYGNVNAARGPLADVLAVNGRTGDSARTVTVRRGEPVHVAVSPPPAGPDPAPFAMYLWEGEPDHPSVLVEQPHALGTLVFASPLSGGGQLPVKIWNNLGWRRSLGFPDLPSAPAPSVLVSARAGVRFPARVTIQGFVADRGSAADGPLAITNAVILRIVE